MPNPLVPQGTLNKIQASITFATFPALNVTPEFLGTDMIGIRFTGKSVVYINTATGAVNSPEPYLPAEVSVHLLKTQSLAGLFKQQMEANSILGDMTVRADAINFPPWDLINSSIGNVGDLILNGSDPGYRVTLEGYYLVNSQMFDLTF